MSRILRLSLLAVLAALVSAVPASGQSTTVVISEYRTRGPNGGNDEFIELRNRSAAPVDVGGGAPPPGDQAPSVTATDPADGATEVDEGADVRVTFSEPVTATDAAFELACAVPFTVSGDGTVLTLDPGSELPHDAQCSVTASDPG